MSNEKFFQTKIDETPKASSANASKNWHFAMEPGENVNIAFLNHDDEDVPPMHYHVVMHDKKVKKVCCMAADHLGGDCHFCKYTAAQPQNDQWKTQLKKEFCYTILDDRDEKDEAGNPRLPKKRLRLSTVTDHKNIKRKRSFVIDKQKKDGLRLKWITLVRDPSLDKQPKVGILDQVVGTEVDESKFDSDFLEPFTFDEILVQFVSDPDEINRIAQDYSFSGGGTEMGGIREV